MKITSPKSLREHWRQNVLQQLWSQTSSCPVYYTDLLFKCEDGSIQAHKMWLANSCSTLGKALQNLHNCFEEQITVMVPDFSVNIVRKFLKLFYTGSVNLSNPWELEDIKEFGCKELGLSMGLDQLKFTKSSPEETLVYTSCSSPRSSNASSSSNYSEDVQSAPFLEPMVPSRLATKYRPRPKKFTKQQVETQNQPEILTQKPDNLFQEFLEEKTEDEALDESHPNDRQPPSNDIFLYPINNGTSDLHNSVSISNSSDDDDEMEPEETPTSSNTSNEDGTTKTADFISDATREGPLQTNPNKTVPCTLCPNRFKNEQRLSFHMKKIHKDDSSFSESQKNRCSHCTLSFSSKIKLSVHIKKKHKKVACMICAMLFVSDVTLRNHMINIHKLPTGINIFN